MYNVVLSVVLGIALFLADRLGVSQRIIHPDAWMIVVFFFGLSLAIERLMAAGFENKRRNFVQFYLSTIVLRMILSLAFIGICLYLGVESTMTFVLNFFVLYLFYTSFEIYFLYRKLRRDS